MIEKTPEISYMLIYEKFSNRLETFFNSKKDLSSFNNKNKCLKALLNCIYTYTRFLNYKYNENSKKILPLKLAKIYLGKENPINNFIKKLNCLHNVTDSTKKEIIIDNIINEFPIELLENFKNEIEQYVNIKNYISFKDNYNKNLISAEAFNQNLINKKNNLGLEKTEYYILQAFFKGNESIQNVWLNGSRAYGTNKYYSDIDLIIECDPKDEKNIITKLNKLPLLHIIDIKFLHNKAFVTFFKQTITFGLQHIYNKETSKIPNLELDQEEIYKIYKQFNFEGYRIMYNDLQIALKIYNKDKNNHKKQQKLVEQVKRVLIRYNKSLKIQLNEKGIWELLPLKIYKKAKIHGIGYHIDDCIEFLNELNAYYDDTNSEDTKFLVGNRIISKINKIQEILNFIENTPQDICYKNFLRALHSIKYTGLLLNDDPIVYNSSLYNIDDSSYNIIINYLKNTPEIKKVWITGSRVHAHSHNGSDIDLMFDYDIKHINQIKNDIKSLKIPYIIDAACINDPNMTKFIKRNSIYACKSFYKKDDLQIYWNTPCKKDITFNTSIIEQI